MGTCIERLDNLSVAFTAFPTFSDLVNAGGNYRPSLGVRSCPAIADELQELADAYDCFQFERGDSRRALRY